MSTYMHTLLTRCCLCRKWLYIKWPLMRGFSDISHSFRNLILRLISGCDAKLQETDWPCKTNVLLMWRWLTCVLLCCSQYEGVLTVSQAMDVYFTRLKYVKHRPRVPFKGNIKLWWVVPFGREITSCNYHLLQSKDTSDLHGCSNVFCLSLSFCLLTPTHLPLATLSNLSSPPLLICYSTCLSPVSIRWKFAYNSVLDEQVKPKLEAWSWVHMKTHRYRVM